MISKHFRLDVELKGVANEWVDTLLSTKENVAAINGSFSCMQQAIELFCRYRPAHLAVNKNTEQTIVSTQTATFCACVA